jgi:hypothetical protein
MPVTTGHELSSFETCMHKLTLGYCLARSMAFATFRRTVLQYHVTGKPSSFRSILANNHLISVDDGIATLYRNMEEEEYEYGDGNDNTSTDCDHAMVESGDDDSAIIHRQTKRQRGAGI